MKSKLSYEIGRRGVITLISCIYITILCYAKVYDIIGMVWDFNAMLWDLYAMPWEIKIKG